MILIPSYSNQSISDRVPYTGATADIDLGSHTLTTTGYVSTGNILAANHYTGFPNRTDTMIAWSDASYTLTLSATGAKIWIDGKEITINTLTKQLTVAQEAVSGLYYFWITETGGVASLNADASPPGFGVCLVATVYWNTTTSKGATSDERHSMGRDKWTHEYLHETVGARFASGMAGTFTDTTITIGAGEFYDEDIEHINAEETNCKVLYHNGDADWAWDVLTTPYKVVNPGADDNLRYNSGNALATVTNNRFANYWVFMTPDINEPVHVVIGTAEYTTLALARAASVPSLGGLPSAEEKLIYKITYQNNGGSPSYQEATDYRTASNMPVQNYVPTNHSSLAGLANDDHPQYQKILVFDADYRCYLATE